MLDVGLADSDGRDVCQALRAHGVSAPVLFLTARDALTDRLSGFHAGGDDYLTKPFALAELIVRISALLRRSGRDGGDVDPATLRLDPATHALCVADRCQPLTPTEFRLFAALAARPGGGRASQGDGRGRLAGGCDRPRQHARHLRPAPAHQVARPGVRTRDRDDARRGVHAAMSRLRIRDRVTIAAALTLAAGLAVLTLAVALLLANRLDHDATAVLHARAGAVLTTLSVSDGRIHVHEPPNDELLDHDTWVFDTEGAVVRADASAAQPGRRRHARADAAGRDPHAAQVKAPDRGGPGRRRARVRERWSSAWTSFPTTTPSTSRWPG